MAAVLGHLEPFVQGTNWREYVEVFEHFFFANDITDDKKKVCILCSYVGSATYHIIKSLCLPSKPEEKTFKDVCDLVDSHFKPKLSEASACLMFYNRSRKKGESVQMYIAALRSLAKPCNFGQFLDRALRDRFIVGVNDEQIQEKILSVKDDELTLDKAYTIAESHEAAARNIREMQSSQAVTDGVMKLKGMEKMQTPVPATAPVVGPRQYQGQRCFRCGGLHDARQCIFKEKNCFRCRKKGHIKAQCNQGRMSGGVNVKNIEHNERCVIESEDEVYTVVCAMGQRKKEKISPIMCELDVHGQKINFELDTGSPFTIMSDETLKTLGSVELDKRKAIPIKSFTGHPVRVLGSVNVCVTHAHTNRQKQADILVTEYAHNLLGRDLIDHFGLLTVNHISESVLLQKCLGSHPGLFEDGVGKLVGQKAKVHVDGNKAPIFFKPRPLPYAMRAKVEHELQRLEAEGIIEPVKVSDWAAPIVPVLKPNGKVRICGDYKVTVNRVSKLEQYPIPTLDDLTAKLGKGSVFHKLDLSHAYSQVELDAESRKYVTINTHKGLFTYTRLPFGVSSAPAQFQRVMETLLEGVPRTVVYFDDILVTGDTVDESYQHLEEVLERLDKAGARLKKEKCIFGADEVVFLGHKISREGIKPVDEKVQAIVQAKAPESVQQLKAYLGLLNYYGRFLKNLSGELHPLHKLLQKGMRWRWGQKEQACFEKTKRMIVSAKVLVHYDPRKPIVMHVDASQYGLGAVMSHILEDGSEHPVGFVSRSLNSAEKNYSQLDKEGAAVVFGLKKFHKYLFGRRFTIVTDHKPLLSLFSEEKQVPVIASPRIQRWAVTLSAYEYTMQYRPGKNHMNADCLSRLPLPETEAMELEDRVLLVEELEDCSFLSARQIAEWTRRNPVLSHVYKYLLSGWPSHESDPKLAPYRVRKSELSVMDGCVLWGARVVVPPKGRSKVLQELHSAHPGINRMKSLARSYVWWPGMDAELEEMVRGCVVCQEHQNLPAAAPLHPWEYPDGPWKRIHVDYAGPIQGDMLLIVVDAYSKWIEVAITKKITSSATIHKLREMFAHHGLPDTLVSDNGTCFTSEEFEDFMRINGIIHVTSDPHHPSSNGLAERAVQSVKRGITKLKGDLHTRLQKYLLWYRITPQSTIGKARQNC